MTIVASWEQAVVGMARPQPRGCLAGETLPLSAQCEQPSPLLKVEDLHVDFLTSRGVVRAVEGLSFHVDRGEVVAIVGESGSGKSVSALSIMRLLPRHTGRVPKGRITFDGRHLLELDDEQMREIRGRDISMIFQEPMTSLNPILTIGLQIIEPLHIHLKMNSRTGARPRGRAVEARRHPRSPSGGSINIRTNSPAACVNA